ncbi:MAG: alpha/beta hydrolase, partial [Actinobacteria bacterium]|nr:alpha/beta hydrolase [Actinomycetota bacterium]
GEALGARSVVVIEDGLVPLPEQHPEEFAAAVLAALG